MKITYKFADGQITEVDVSEEIGSVIVESRREEENLARKERYHCCSLEAFSDSDNGEHTPRSDERPDTELELLEENKRIYESMMQLSETQRRRLLLLAEGHSVSDIARMEKASFNSVKESINAGQKKFIKFFSKTPSKKHT